MGLTEVFLMIRFDNFRPKDFRAFGWIIFGFLLFVSSAVSFPALCPQAGPGPAPGERKVVFVFHPPQPAGTVHVVGSFNHWDREATPLVGPDQNGDFRGVLYLSPGLYVYKFLVDGKKWLPDPSAAGTEDDGFGGRNSVLEVGKMPSRKTGDGRVDYESLMHRQCLPFLDIAAPIRKGEPLRAVLRVRARRGDVRSCRLVIQGKGFFAMQPLFQTRLYTFFQATVPVAPEGLNYAFEVETAKKSIYLSKHGVADTMPVTGYFTLRPDAPEVHAEPPDWVRDAVFYQIFPERFNNGDRGNDPPGVLAWGQAPSPDTFFGGDLKGILDRLNYLQDLGVNALYLNPIFDAASTHKYDTRDYLKVDPAFGDAGLLGDLVSACHERGIRLILDGVFNHTGTPFFAFKDLLLKQESSPYKDWYFVHSYPVRTEPANYESWWGISSLPKLNTANRETREYLLNVATHWIREANIDGWRLDVPDEIPHDFWKEFRKRVRTTSSDAFVVGEIWSDGTSWLQGDQFDSVMNYRLRTHILDFFVYRRIQAGTFDRRVQQDFLDYRASTSHALLNLLGSHDTERILTLAKTDRVRVLSAFNFFFAFPGVPMVYYGDEVGLEGGKDPDCRRCMEWDSARQDRSLHSHIRNLIHLRRQLPALRRGDLVPLGSESRKGIVAFARCLQGQWVVAIFHNGPGTASWSLPLRTPGVVSPGFKGLEKAPAGHPVELIGSAAPKRERGFLHVTLQPWSSAWILLEDS